MHSLLLSALLLFLIISCISSSYDEVKNCLGEYINFKPNEVATDDPFYLHFGDKTVEIVDILSSKDIKRIRRLASCIQLSNSSYVDFQIPHDNKNKHLGYGNITHLNGYFHSLLQPLYDKIIKISDDVITQVEWVSPKKIVDLGIRCVRLVSYTASEPMKTKEEIRQIIEKRKRERPGFVVSPHAPIPELPNFEDENINSLIDTDLNSHEIDIDSDLFISKFIQPAEDSLYTLFLMLSTREEYYGGNLLVQKSYEDDPVLSNNDHLDTIDEEDEEEQIRLEKEFSDYKNQKLFTRKHKFDPLTSSITRHTPDKGNAILLHSHQPHGIQPITQGSIQYLVFELWPYDHAEIGTLHRLTLDEAKLTHTTELHTDL